LYLGEPGPEAGCTDEVHGAHDVVGEDANRVRPERKPMPGGLRLFDFGEFLGRCVREAVLND
jgi:hypothetical protein